MEPMLQLFSLLKTTAIESQGLFVKAILMAFGRKKVKRKG
jgi:hypothetical protein